MAGLENRTYKMYNDRYELDDEKIMFYGHIEFDSLLPLLGIGSTSAVYKIRIGNKFWALKVFNGLRHESLENYQNKSKLDIKSYISPIRIMYLNGKFNGYLMNFCSGKDLEKRKLNISIDEFSKKSDEIFDDTHKLSLKRYNIYDSYISNVMYDDGFKMVDMDDYPYNSEDSIEQIEEMNKQRLNQMLVDVLIKNAGIANMIFSNVELQKLINSCKSGKISFKELYDKICLLAYNNSKQEISEISEIGKALKNVKL